MAELRSPEIITEPLTEGDPNVRVSEVVSEPLTEGDPSLRVSLFISEPLVNSYRNLRASLMMSEVLQAVPPELPVSTETFPGFGNSVSDPSVPAAADPFNTALPGLAYSVHKKPGFKTRISEAASGAEVRNALAEYPRWDFEFRYEFLEDRSGANSSLKTIMGFFLSRLGSFDSWLLKDPDDYLVTNNTLGTGDGVTTQFLFLRNLGGFNELVNQVDTDNTISVYADDVLVDPGDYTVTMPNLLVFDTAPAEGVVITASFQFFFACRFIEDQMDFEKFMDKLWNLQQVEFRSIIQ